MESLDFYISQEVGNSNVGEAIPHQTNQILKHIHYVLESVQLKLLVIHVLIHRKGKPILLMFQ